MNHAHAADAPGNTTAGNGATELLVSGMNCNNCALHVTEAIQGVPGVRSATVVLEAGRASVRWAAGATADVPGVVAAVKAAGYEAKPVESIRPDHVERRRTDWQLNLWIGVLGTVPLMVGEWVFGLGMTGWFRWASFVLAGVVQVFAGARFYRGAWSQLKAGRSNMDTLVALGSTTAFGYSAWALLSGAGGHVFFMEASAIISLISIGHWLEARVSARASSALRRLMRLAPEVARRRGPDGGETEVPVAELNAGDLVALRPGDRVPTDGLVVEGDSAVDESMLTGESVPVDKRPKAELYAGTVNLNGRLLMRVTATGEATALANIVAAVERAQSSRANIQRLGDRVSSVFVPAVVLVALVTALWWGLAPDSAQQAHAWLAKYLWAAHPPAGALAAAFIGAAAVLIVACPCAMGLATPAAIMAGANAAARRGILIRDGVALEKAGQITAVVFDKTGTLTVGKPEVVQVMEIGSPKSETRNLAVALAQHSTHPISQAVAAACGGADSQGTGNNGDGTNAETFQMWEEVRGAGVQGSWQGEAGMGKVARLGSLRWLQEAGVDLAAGQAFVREWSGQGATIVGLAVDRSLRGLFAVKDTLKPGAQGVVEQLHRQSLRAYLVTGDNALTAASIARQAGIPAEHVFAEVRPEQKAGFVQRLQQGGERVAFVGDGINDAPALEQADLGVAVSRASDIAREAADLILLKSGIEAVPEALGLARATLRTIKQNLFWAFFYNTLSVPLAALGFLSPILCAAAMGVSDLVVIGNALRLGLRR